MAQSKAHIKASNKYNAKAYDQLKVLVKKGQRDVIKQYAESKGLSLNGYINKLISDDMNATQSDSTGTEPEEQ
ncbi:MAG: hypothetical protein K2J39_02610 [Ruminococcus sp.]|nr:hypothetical protein [Ruminococcus sp.]